MKEGEIIDFIINHTLMGTNATLDWRKRDALKKQATRLIKDYALESRIDELERIGKESKKNLDIYYAHRISELKAPHKNERINTVTGKEDSIPIKVILSPERGQADPLDEDDILEELR